MKIIFGSLGFASASIFVEYPVEIETRVLDIGVRFDRYGPKPEIWIYNSLWQNYLKREELPSEEEIEAEYQRQYKEKGVWINNEIAYAG